LDDIDEHAESLSAAGQRDAQALGDVQAWLRAKVQMYREKYEGYFKRQNARYRADTGLDKVPLDSLPRVILVPGACL
jgi:rhamnose utilization protein RhaD (predicted bifunctional aldolase and dehydrogenase)